jgi:transposase
MIRDSRKYPLSEETFYSLINPLIEEEKKKSGRPTKISHYQFFCGLLYVLRTGISWRDLPAEYGRWHTIYTRYKRWSETGFFWKLLAKLQSRKEVVLDIVFVDGSIVPLHRHGGGALKK